MKPTDERQLRSWEGELPARAGGGADQWLRVKEVFLEALDHPEAERAALISVACRGDAGLQDEVISLLASEKAAGTFCETPAAELLNFDGTGDGEPTARLAVGAQLGPYELTGFVSAGGMGEIYKARHTILDRQVAIKTVRVRSAGWAANRRLVAEARHASRLDHSNICTIYEVGEEGGIPFIAMEYIDGTQLREMIRSAIPSLDQALGFGTQIADALEHAHRHGIVHRDLKSSNIVVDRSGRPIVLDFGLAKRLPGIGGERMDDSTATGSPLAGTLSHMGGSGARRNLGRRCYRAVRQPARRSASASDTFAPTITFGHYEPAHFPTRSSPRIERALRHSVYSMAGAPLRSSRRHDHRVSGRTRAW